MLLSTIFTFSTDKVQCPITLFELFQDDALSAASSPNSVALSSSNIALINANNLFAASINYKIDASYKISFYIRGSSNGRVYNNGAFVKVTVIVCGGEQLTLAPNAQTIYSNLYSSTGPNDIIDNSIYDSWFVFTVGPSDITCRHKEY